MDTHVVPFKNTLSEDRENMNNFLSTEYADVDKMVDDLTCLVQAAALKCSVLKVQCFKNVQH
jgi:hypothetical protein